MVLRGSEKLVVGQLKETDGSNTPLDLSIAKAQMFGWRVFEVKCLKYTLFQSAPLEHRNLTDLVANCVSCA